MTDEPEVTYTFYDLPIDVPCPVCAATGLKIETQLTTSPDIPCEGGLVIGGRTRATRYRLIPCCHLLRTYRWERPTAEDPVRWTLTPLEW